MRTKGTKVACFVFAAVAAWSSSHGAAPALTEAGEKLQAGYAARVLELKGEISQSVPAVDEQKNAVFQKAREAVRQAITAEKAAQEPLDRIKKAKGLVEHAKGKWIGSAEKGIDEARKKLAAAATDDERQAAREELEKWRKNKEEGLQALAERQAALDDALAEEAKHIQASEAAQAALAEALAAELQAAKAMLADVMQFLSGDGLDAMLVKCAVLSHATPRGLAEFAQQGQEQEALVEKLLADPVLMKAMLEAGGARGGNYGQAMQVYAGIRKASARAGDGIFHRLALATSVEHASPIAQRNAKTETDAPPFVDPVQRYLHYEKACLDGELDPAFPTLSAWEYRSVVNSYAPDHILAWGREMLRNYRPDHIFNPDYGWRYSGIVRTDVAYRHSYEYQDTDSLHFFQNIIRNGGICGRRAFFGRFICKSFGLPTWGVAQHAHAAVGRWTPAGWVVNFGGGWEKSWGPPEESESGRRGLDFILEAQARKYPDEFMRSLRAQWVGEALAEERYDSRREGSGGLWNTLALFQKKVIVAEAKPLELAALGTELGEANESAETKAKAVDGVVAAAADRLVVVDSQGVITIPVAACAGAQLMKSFLGGQQSICGGPLSCDVEVPSAGKYALTARVVTVHGEDAVHLTLNGSKEPVAVAIPYTIGAWQKTEPVEVTLVQGKNTLSFSKAASTYALRDFTLTPQ